MNQKRLIELFDYSDGVLTRKKNGKLAGSVNARGYVQSVVDGRLQYNHRIIFLMKNGYLSDCIDHIDGNKQNNRIENLRAATVSQNGCNAKVSSRNKSGYKSVRFHKASKKWIVQFTFNGKAVYFGLYEDVELADLVATEARNKLHGSFARHM